MILLSAMLLGAVQVVDSSNTMSRFLRRLSLKIFTYTSSGTAPVPRPYSAAVASFSSVALFSGVPAWVGSSARTMSKVLACPATGVIFTRPG